MQVSHTHGERDFLQGESLDPPVQQLTSEHELEHWLSTFKPPGGSTPLAKGMRNLSKTYCLKVQSHRMNGQARATANAAGKLGHGSIMTKQHGQYSQSYSLAALELTSKDQDGLMKQRVPRSVRSLFAKFN